MTLRPSALALLAAAAALLLLLVFEFQWRGTHALLKPQAAAPGGALVAEVRSLPDAGAPEGGHTGVYLREGWEWLRAPRPRLVFAGACDNVDARWFGAQRLVIECELRAGEPRLLQRIVDGVVIELVVQRRFALQPASAVRTARAPSSPAGGRTNPCRACRG